MRRLILMGPSYGLRSDQRKADFEFLLGFMLGSVGAIVPEHKRTMALLPCRRHTTLIDVGRTQIMEAVLKSNADIALMVDSDIYLDIYQDKTVLPILVNEIHEMSIKPDGIAIKAATYILRDLFPCVWTDKGREQELVIKRRFIEAAGAGFWLMNLNWYRKHWPAPARWFQLEYLEVDKHRGEDIFHCREVRKRGGQIEQLPFEAKHAPL